MLEKYSASQTLGLSFDVQSLKGAKIFFTKKNPVIEKLFTIPFEESSQENVKPLDIGEKKSLAEISYDCLTVSGMTSSATLVRSMEIKLTKAKDVKAVLAFQAEPLLPYAAESAILDSITTGHSAGGTLLTLVSVRKDQLKTHLNRLQAFGIEPEAVSCTPIALAAFASYFAISSALPVFVIHIDTYETSCILTVDDGKLLAAHSFPQGVLNLAAGLAKDTQASLQEAFQSIREFDFSSLSPIKNPQLHQAWEVLRLDIARTLFAIAKQAKAQPVAEILLTGEGGTFPTLVAALSQGLGKPLTVPKEKLEQDTPTLQRYAIPIGLALSALPTNKEPINFRQQEFAYPNPWKRFKVPLILYFSLCLLVSLLFYLLTTTWIGYQEDKLKEKYVTLLADINKPYPIFEKEFTKSTDEEIVPVKDLSQQQIMDRLEYLYKEIKATPDIFPLLPNIPKVSDVLAWLATHPNVSLKGKPNEALIQIGTFSYTMVKRPEQSKKQEKYQVKIEMGFTASTPKLAREFHDALIAPNDFVDPKGEIKWTSSRDSYRTSFFLKDKTSYPSSGG